MRATPSFPIPILSTLLSLLSAPVAREDLIVFMRNAGGRSSGGGGEGRVGKKEGRRGARASFRGGLSVELKL